MSFGEEEYDFQTEMMDNHYRKERIKREQKEKELKKEISKKSKKELIQIAYEAEILRKPHNSIPINVKSIDVRYSLEKKCFYAWINLDFIDDTICLIECNKAYDLPIHY